MKKSRRRKKLIAIIVMLALCVAAASYIILHVKGTPSGRDDAGGTDGYDSEVTDGSETDDAAGEDSISRAQRVYSGTGTSDDEEYSAGAIDRAAEAGAGSLALPFVVGKDGTLYITDNDYVYDRTGYAGYLSGMTDQQIAGITTTSGTSFVKLSDVFEKYGSSVGYVIEIRYTGTRNIEALAALIREYGLEDAVTVSSEYYTALRRMDDEMPDLPKLFLCSDEEGLNTAIALSYVDVISVDKSMMTESVCSLVHDRGKLFGARTLNTEEEIRTAISTGVDSYYTDEALLAVSIENGQGM